MSEPGKIEYNQKEQDARYTESWQTERDVLESLQRVWQAIINDDGSETSSDTIKYEKDHLENNLQESYNAWQFFEKKGKEGLNSGTIGEALTRILGSGILEDLPEVEKLPYHTYDFGVIIKKCPKSTEQTGEIEVLTRLGREFHEPKACRFEFMYLTSISSTACPSVAIE